MGVAYKYKGQETCNLYVEMSKEGKTDIQIAAKMGVSTGVFTKWDKSYPEFKQAREIGKTASEAWCIEYFQNKGTGEKYKDGDFQSMRWLTMNKFGWNDKAEAKITQEDLNIKIEFVDPKEVANETE